MNRTFFIVTAAIANGGEVVAPRLVDRLVSANGEVRDLGSRGLGRVMSASTGSASPSFPTMR